MHQRNMWAFTLVELIVVITIVGILSTIGFVSYSGYLTWARDSNRISQMVKLSDSLQVYSATKTLPLPDNYVEIQASWSTIAYQWEVWVDVLETIDYTNGGTDPKDDSYYSYMLTKDRNSMQLMALMEEQWSVAQTDIQINPIIDTTYAADYSDRYPKVYGRKLWILTELGTNTPVQQLSLTTFEILTETGYTWHISDDEKVSWDSAWDLVAIIPDGSCKRIKQTGWASGNGTYTINPGWTGKISVYCDMETSGWGWTMVARSVAWGTWSFWWNISTGDVNDDTQPYSMGSKWTSIPFDQVFIAGYESWKIIWGSMNFKMNAWRTDLLPLTSTTASFTVIDMNNPLWNMSWWTSISMWNTSSTTYYDMWWSQRNHPPAWYRDSHGWFSPQTPGMMFIK